MNSRMIEYYIVRYGDKYVTDFKLTGENRDIIGFSLADSRMDADIFWKDSSYDMRCLNKLLFRNIGVVKEARAKYVSEVVL